MFKHVSAQSCSPPGDRENDSWTGPRDLGLDCWYSSISDGGPPHQVHRAVINGIVDVGAGFQLSGLYFYGSGQRYDSYNVSDLRDTGGFFVGWPASAQRLEADGTIKDHAAITGNKINRVDVRLMRRFNLGRATVDGIVEVFNLFNYENYGKYQGCTCSPAYANPTYNPDVAYWPRIVQLAFRELDTQASKRTVTGWGARRHPTLFFLYPHVRRHGHCCVTRSLRRGRIVRRHAVS